MLKKCITFFPRGTYEGRTVAIKIFSENNLAYDEQEIRREAALMSILDHPNLVRYVGACLKPKSMLIITDLYPAKYLFSTPFLIPFKIPFFIAYKQSSQTKHLNSL